MSSDFYLKARTLHEEFEKKELHYLNVERKLNDSIMRKKDLNVPLQEYLRKIHQREKENEETYQSIMKQMNELDQRTDLLCLKIEKLGIFRNIQVGHNLTDTNYSFASKFIPQTMNNTVRNFNIGPVASEFELNNLKSSTSTQTDSYIYCNNCGSEIQISCQASLVQDSTSSIIDILSVSKDKSQVNDSLRLQNDSFSKQDDNAPQFITPSLNTEHSSLQNCLVQNQTFSTTDILTVNKNAPQIIDSLRLQNVSFTGKDGDHPQFIASSSNTEHLPSQVHENGKHVEKIFENVLQTNENNESKSHSTSFCSPKKSKNTKEVLEKIPPLLKSDEILTSGNAMKNSGSKQILAETQSMSNDSEINVEVSASKSDGDSINHEFDFLESDTAHMSSKTKSQNASKNNTIPLNNVDKNMDQIVNANVELSNKSSMKPRNVRSLFQLKNEQDTNDNRSETSESVSGNRSPVISMSDSDSVDEKGSFTASTAYQSLLGNTVFPSKVSKQISESETEDEVEKTLASTVQKANIKQKSSVPSKKDKTIPQAVESKSSSNKPKPLSTNKPQSKLSKSTKKVLGIDTSSSSEVEAAVKPLDNENEDSDEFDFYN